MIEPMPILSGIIEELMIGIYLTIYPMAGAIG